MQSTMQEYMPGITMALLGGVVFLAAMVRPLSSADRYAVRPKGRAKSPQLAPIPPKTGREFRSFTLLLIERARVRG
jgi:hypothetical protein